VWHIPIERWTRFRRPPLSVRCPNPSNILSTRAMRGVLGIAVILLFAWALSENRTRVPWRVVTVGVLLQLVLAFLFLRFPPPQNRRSGRCCPNQSRQRHSERLAHHRGRSFDRAHRALHGRPIRSSLPTTPNCAPLAKPANRPWPPACESFSSFSMRSCETANHGSPLDITDSRSGQAAVSKGAYTRERASLVGMTGAAAFGGLPSPNTRKSLTAARQTMG
jgi:Na+ dependent nucleoside transporter N-terminus